MVARWHLARATSSSTRHGGDQQMVSDRAFVIWSWVSEKTFFAFLKTYGDHKVGSDHGFVRCGQTPMSSTTYILP